MSDDTSTRAAPDRPARFIPGVYNYCDRWCERCRFRQRCYSHHLGEQMQQNAEAGTRAGDELEGIDTAAMSASQRLDLETFIADANRPPSADEAAAIEAWIERSERLLQADPLANRAEEYGLLAHGAIRAFEASGGPGQDPVVLAAIEAIRYLALTIAGKARRAVSSWIEARDPEWGDECDMSDANGSAKVARLAIAESREAWGVLMEAGRATADGVPLRMIGRLAELEAALAARFPEAMAFVRAGFDDLPGE